MTSAGRLYEGTMTARLKNINPSHEIEISEATEIINFLTLKKDSLIKRKAGLRFLSSIAHRQPISFEASTEELNVFTAFKNQGWPYKQTPFLVNFEDIMIGGKVAIVKDNFFVLKDDPSTRLGIFDRYQGTLQLNPAATFSSTITIELFDPILAIGSITTGRAQQVLMTDGRSLFRYTPAIDSAPDYSYSIAKLDYTPPANLTNLWWLKEVFLESAESGTKGRVLLSAGTLSPAIPVFQYKTDDTGPIKKFEPKTGEKRREGVVQEEYFLTSMKRVHQLKNRLFAAGVIQKTVMKSDPDEVLSEIDKRVAWSATARDPTADGSWDRTLTNASYREIDNPVADSAILNDSLVISTNRGFWVLNIPFDGESVHSEKILDNFPSFPGFVNLSSRGILYSANTRGIFQVSEKHIENISEKAGVDVAPVLSYVSNAAFQNYFSLVDEREGVYYFYNQERPENFSGQSVVYSLENRSFSFFREQLTCGENVVFDEDYRFSNFTKIGDLNYTRSASLREGSVKMVLGDVQGNIYVREETAGTGNRWFIGKGSTPVNQFVEGEFLIQGEGFKTEKYNRVFKWRSKSPDELLDENDNPAAFITDLGVEDFEGRWIVLEDMVFQSGQINAFKLKKRAVLKEIRIFVRNLTKSGIKGQLTVEAFNPQNVLMQKTLDLSKRSESFLFGKWIKTLIKTSGMSVGFRLYISDKDKFSGNSRFNLDINSLQIFAKH